MPAETLRRLRAAPAVPSTTGEGLDLIPYWGLMLFTFVLWVSPQSYFPVLQPLYLAKVPALIALGTYLVGRLVSGRPLTIMPGPIRLVLALLAFAVVSIPFSRWPGGSVDALTNDFLKSVLVFILIANTLSTVPRIKLFVGALIAWTVQTAYVGVQNYRAGLFTVGGFRIEGYDSPLAADPNDYALTLSLILGLVIGVFSVTRRWPLKILLLATMALFVAGIVTSFSRGGFLTLVAVLIAVSVDQVRRHGALGLVVVLLVVVVAMALLPAGYSDRVYSIFDADYDPTGSSTSRWDGMVLAFHLMLERPLTGYGLRAHSLLFPERGLGWQGAHSAFLQLGADLGVPAFIAYVCLFWQLFRSTRRARQRLEGVPQASILLGIARGTEFALWAFIVGGSLLPVAYRWYFYFIAGLVVATEAVSVRLAASRQSPRPATRSVWWRSAPARDVAPAATPSHAGRASAVTRTPLSAAAG